MDEDEFQLLHSVANVVEEFGVALLRSDPLLDTRSQPSLSQWTCAPVFEDPAGLLRTHALLYRMGAINLMIGAAVAARSAPQFNEEVLARASVEGASMAWWILSDSDPKERARRILIDRIWSLKERSKTLATIDDAMAAEEEEKLLNKAKALTTHGKAAGLLGEKENPEGSRNVTEIMGLMLDKSHVLSGNFASSAYRHLSGFGHLNPLSLLERRDRTNSTVDSTGSGWAHIPPSLSGIATSLYLAASGCLIMEETMSDNSETTAAFSTVEAAYFVALTTARTT